MVSKINGITFKKDIEGKNYVVEFMSPWCGPCQLMKQVFNVLSDRMADKIMVGMADITECEGLVEEYKITDYKSVQSKNREKKINYGLRLFAKHMRSLWY